MFFSTAVFPTMEHVAWVRAILKPGDVNVMLNRIRTACLFIEKNTWMQKLLARDGDSFRGINRSHLRYDLQNFTPGSPGCWLYCKWGLRNLLMSVSPQSPRVQVPAWHCQSVTMIHGKSGACSSQWQVQIHLSTDTQVPLSGGLSRTCFYLLWRPELQSARMSLEDTGGVVSETAEPPSSIARKKLLWFNWERLFFPERAER